MKLLGLGSLILLASCGEPEKSPEFKSDLLFLETINLDDNKVFKNLPLEANLDAGDKFWSGDFWAINKGLINKRWNSPTPTLDYVPPTKDELALMSETQIAELSPSEKYDLLLGRYDYPLKKEVDGKINKTAMNWEGIGNGWAISSSSHREPTPKVLENPDGIMIPFGSSDIKALLSYYYAFSHKGNSQQLGKRCDQRNGWGDQSEECKDDLNAGSFHVVLTNLVGIKKMTLIMDMDRYFEVWNHPVIGYKSEVTQEVPPTPKAPAGTVKSLHMKTTLSYVDQAWNNSWDPLKATSDQVNTKRVFTYTLHLNAAGLILGGDWKSADRPDFLWLMTGTTSFEGRFSALGHLIDD